MSVVELPPPTDPATIARLRSQVHIKFKKGNLLMARNRENSAKWELVKVIRAFRLWILDEYEAVYLVSYADGHTRMCYETDLRHLSTLLHPEAWPLSDAYETEPIPGLANFREEIATRG